MKRRDFINKLGLGTAAIYGLSACAEKPQKEAILNRFGIQLWTLKEDMEANTEQTLKAVADAGFHYVESFGGGKGVFWGYSAADFGKLLADLGLHIQASHCNSAYTLDLSLEDEFKKLADDAASLKMSHLINPFAGEDIKTEDDWKRVADGLNRLGAICKAAGLKAGYHNHHYEFHTLESNQKPEQILLGSTDPDLVDFELDMYWVKKANEDPINWLKEHKNRFKLCHIKDMIKEPDYSKIVDTETVEGTFWPAGTTTYLGNGQIDYAQIIPMAKDLGMEHFIVEQERFDNSSPLSDLPKNAQYMKKFITV